MMILDTSFHLFLETKGFKMKKKWQNSNNKKNKEKIKTKFK